ncbi:MAG: hypothetical protein N3B18_09435 [Desulfobacterota bacterium]|nr:hypothetical protein [Thermodesulfobacteriota bacterium]
MKPLQRFFLFFLAGSIVYGGIILVFAVMLDGRGISRSGPIIYPAELLPIIPILLWSLCITLKN